MELTAQALEQGAGFPMTFRPLDLVKLPFWTLALATGAKSFRDNRVIGSPALNRRGLHVGRVKLAHRLAWSRRQRLESLVSPEDRAAFTRDGFVMKRDFLDADSFARLKDAVLAFEAPAREMIQGDTITRRIALDGLALDRLPMLRALFNRPDWRGLLRYVGSYDQEPLYYIQTILSHMREGAPDPQTNLHADTFHPSVKAWLFLTDVARDEGPFVFVPGSHLMTERRLAWEQEMSIRAAENSDRYSARGSFRIMPNELERLGLGPPQAFAVPANTLVVADTVGFHARGLSARPSKRVEIWAYGRRNPFLPWTGLDLLSLPGIAEARVPLMWKALDLAQRLHVGRNSWRDVGIKTPLSDV
jgi:Phytanoyl-CoA dioxygenase (PhyH)